VTEGADVPASQQAVASTAAAASQPAAAASQPAAASRVRKHARVTTAAVDGADPHPAPEAPRSSGTENDARLKADKPPHWG
jgi:hypothetical protein